MIMALREMDDSSKVILMSKFGERSNSGNTAQSFALGSTALHPAKQPGVKHEWVSITCLERKSSPESADAFPAPLGIRLCYLGLIFFALCTRLKKMQGSLWCESAVTSLDTWQASLTACPHLLVQGMCHLPIFPQWGT